MTLRDTPILHVSGQPELLKILVLGGYHPIELIVPFLDKVTKSGIIDFNASMLGGLLFFNETEGGLNRLIMGRRLEGRTRVTIVSRQGL